MPHKVRPIIFSTPMAAKLWKGEKTETRRLDTSPLAKCEPGDILYIRECFSYDRLDVDKDLPSMAWYWADGNPESGDYTKPKPNIHMPRIYSRQLLIVEEVRFHPIRAITEESCKAEGADRAHRYYSESTRSRTPTYREGFRQLWNSLHNKPGETWRDNPRVVAIKCKHIRANVDAYLSQNQGG